MSISRYVLLTITLQGALSSAWLPQSQGAATPPGWVVVTGRVIDARGRPVADARVSAFPLDVAISGGMPNQPITNQEGRYRLMIPPYPGRTRLCAIKESAGYPDTQGLLFSSPTDAMPEIRLSGRASLDNVDIRLGVPDGVLEASVVDARTGTPVSKARVNLHRDVPESMYSGNVPPEGRFSFALPPVPIQLSIDAPGYQRWDYKDSSTGVSYLLLPAGEHKRIVIQLVPSPGQTQ